jgi:hypothetical protein
LTKRGEETVPRMRSPLAQHPDRYWIMEGLSAPMKGGYKGYHAPGLQVDKSGPPTTFSTRLKENYSRKHPAKVIASTPDLNKKNEKLSPEWHATLLTPSAGQQSASPLANGIFHNDHIEPSEILKICKPVDIEKTPELNTAPSSYLVASVQPSVGAGNLEDSNFPAAQHSSTRSATAPSSSSEATSSSSKATSISSEVSSTSILPNYTTLRIDAKYYISMDLPMPSYYTSKWEGSIKKLLETSISSSLAIRDDGEAALMLEVYMAGITKEVLKPSIWITCCSSRMKKKLKSHLKTLQWLENSGFQYFIRVDKTFGYRTDDSTDIDEQTLIEARLPQFPRHFAAFQLESTSCLAAFLRSHK